MTRYTVEEVRRGNGAITNERSTAVYELYDGDDPESRADRFITCGSMEKPRNGVLVGYQRGGRFVEC